MLLLAPATFVAIARRWGRKIGCYSNMRLSP